MTRQSDLHNLLTKRVVTDIIGPAVKGGATYGDFMVLFESIELAFLETLHVHYGLSPQVASGMVEASVDNAITRFVRSRNAEGTVR